jgi:hypothetical protein
LTATSAQKNSPEFSSCKFLLNPPAAELLGPMKGGKPQQIKNKKTKRRRRIRRKGVGYSGRKEKEELYPAVTELLTNHKLTCVD